MSSSNQNQVSIFGVNVMSVHRPAWIQNDLHAFNNCYRVKRIDKNFFIRTKGFAKKEGLALLNSVQQGLLIQPAQPARKK